MHSLITSRRDFLKITGGTILLGSLGINTNESQSSPLIMGMVVSSVAFAIASLYKEIGNESQQRLEREKIARSFVLKRYEYLFSTLPLSEQLAVYQDGGFYKALVSDDFDRIGSMLAITNGKIHISRGNYGGQVHSDIASTIAQQILPKESRLPVPIRQRPMTDDRLVESSIDWIAGNSGISTQQFKDNFSPKIITEMALGRNPTGNSDYAFITSINKKTTQAINGRVQSNLAVHAIPKKAYENIG